MEEEKKQKIKIAALQMNSAIGDIEKNCDKIDKIVSTEISDDADILILPEVWTCGWACRHFTECAEDIDKAASISLLKKIAKEHNINILGGSIILKKNNLLYNSCPVIDRNGKLLATYEKNHLFSYYGCDEGKYITAGTNPVMVNLEGINIGLTICFDIRFPEIYRAYRKAGADLLVNMAAWGLSKPIPWEMMTRSRAIENQTYMVALTQSGPIEDNEFNIGHSRIIDYNGNIISEIKDQREGIMFAEINLNEMYEFREKCTILNDIKENYEVKSLCVK